MRIRTFVLAAAAVGFAGAAQAQYGYGNSYGGGGYAPSYSAPSYSAPSYSPPSYAPPAYGYRRKVYRTYRPAPHYYGGGGYSGY